MRRPYSGGELNLTDKLADWTDVLTRVVLCGRFARATVWH